jgi:hypothetical protein
MYLAEIFRHARCGFGDQYAPITVEALAARPATH